MRHQLKYRISELQRSNTILRKKVNSLGRHSHLPNGQIVINYLEYEADNNTPFEKDVRMDDWF